MNPKAKVAIAAIDDAAWIPIEYTDAVFDENTLFNNLFGRNQPIIA